MAWNRAGRTRDAAGSMFEALEARQLLAVINWDGGGDGTTLIDPLNWAGDVLPAAADDAVVDVPGVSMIGHSSGTFSVNSLTMAEDFTMAGGILEVATPSVFSGETDWSGGTIDGAGRVIIPAGSTLNIGGPVSPELIIQNFGTINWTSGDIESNGAPFWITNQAGGTFTMSGLNATMGSGTLANYGTTVVAPPPGGVITIEARVLNFADVVIASGKLRLLGGGRLNDSVTVSTPEGLDIQGTFEYFSGTISGAGSVRFLGGNQILHQLGLDLQTDAVIQGASFSGSGDLTIGSRVEWRSGRIGGTGSMMIVPAGRLVLTGPLTKELGRDTTSDGAITHTGGALRFLGGVSLANDAHYTLGGTGQVLSVGAGNSIENTGTLVKLGAGTSTIQPALNNTGAANVGGGILNVSGGGTNTGSRHIAVGSSLVYRSDYTHGAGATATGAGSLVCFGGTQDIAGDWTAASVVKMVAGTLAGLGDLTATGPFFWLAGNMFGPGDLVIAPTGKLAIISGAERELGRRVVNSGLVIHSDGELMFSGGVLSNSATGTIVLVQGGEITAGNGGGSINNAGTLKKIGASTITLSQGGPALNNTGTVEVRGGELNVASSVSQLVGTTLAAGTWRVLPLGTLRFGNQVVNSLGGNAVVEIFGGAQRMPALESLESNAGTLRLLGGGSLQVNPLGGTFTNNGRIELLNPMAVFGVNGALVQGAGGHLVTTASGPLRFSRVFANSATLGGGYTMSFLGGFTGAVGMALPFLTVGTRVGEFGTVVLPEQAALQYTTTGARVLIVAAGG